MEPATEGELFDLLQTLFGIGDYDADLTAEPYWKWRGLEVAKIKRSLASRKITVKDAALAARYCKAHGIDIRAVTWLYKHLPAAIRWDNERRRQEKSHELDELIEQAIEYEASHPTPSPWLDRLVRARGPHRQEVYDLWKQHSQIGQR